MLEKNGSELNPHEKNLILRGRILFAVEQYVRRTGESSETTKQVVYRWLNSREYYGLKNRRELRKPHRA